MIRWSILIATLARRAGKLAQVLDDLAPQMTDEIEIVAYRNHGERRLSEIRQALVTDARGIYLNFVDDDDRLPEYYVKTILPLLDGVDYIGWRMQAYVDGFSLKPTYHTLDARSWWETDTAYFRDISHLNPIRAELARLCDFTHGEPPEDVSWADQMRLHCRTQNLCGDQIMYHYYASSGDCSWRPGSQHHQVEESKARYPDLPIIGTPGFRWHPDST